MNSKPETCQVFDRKLATIIAFTYCQKKNVRTIGPEAKGTGVYLNACGLTSVSTPSLMD